MCIYIYICIFLYIYIFIYVLIYISIYEPMMVRHVAVTLQVAESPPRLMAAPLRARHALLPGLHPTLHGPP